ncbi:MAG: hypothetical protein ACM3S5_08185 [Rhodospirillales bacterium]
MVLEKLRPDQDLQCYFERPSAIAALSGASATGFTISGCWRQQFDWAVLEWNRDNVFEHPAFRNLPDGDLSGLELTYDEVRTNCMPMDSDLYPTVEWPYLRIWIEGAAMPRLVRLRDYATPVEGDYVAATAEFELEGTPTGGDYIGVAWGEEQYNFWVAGWDTLETAAAGLASAINAGSSTVRAAASGTRLILTATEPGANWNRVGVYGFVSGARTERWTPWYAQFSGGVSPSKWRVHLNFGNLTDIEGQVMPTTNVRKMRWTWAADFQRGGFERTEFSVEVSNWTVTGSNRTYVVAGPGSRRIEDDAPEVSYTGEWNTGRGNFSGGTIRWTESAGAGLSCTYRAQAAHSLYLGTRRAYNGGRISVSVDGGEPIAMDLLIPGEDVLVRAPLGTLEPGTHTVAIEFEGPAGSAFYFDFLEIAIPTAELRVVEADDKATLATDWDTDHSICLAPERTAWAIDALGFRGRQNHYVGAMWFYELVRAGHQYASATVVFEGAPVFGPGERTEVTIGRLGDPGSTVSVSHLHYIGDTAETVAKALELKLNRGFMAVWAEAEGNVLRVYSRSMGTDGNNATISASTTSAGFTVHVSGPTLAGGVDGVWRTDLHATPRLNRAARDWTRSFFVALKARGIDAVAALSMELQHGDDSPEAGIAQRGPAGDPVWVNTPALQTNFSPASIAFWREAFRDLAQIMQEAGMQPYLQFGECQWWYFRDNRSGMPFYDEYTKAAFFSAYGTEMGIITEHTVPVAQYPREAAFLPTLIGNFTDEVMAYVRQSFPDCRFEVLYPLDVNESELNTAVNYPAADWTPEKLDCLKTESFGFTYGRDLDKCLMSIRAPLARNFPRERSAHLIGISDPTSPWMKEARLAKAENVESLVLFALDQFCLIGYPIPAPRSSRRSSFQG